MLQFYCSQKATVPGASAPRFVLWAAFMAVNNPPIPLKANLAIQICGVNIFCLIGL
jgi:hypothetical protein